MDISAGFREAQSSLANGWPIEYFALPYRLGTIVITL